jgi:magnesium-transporting ATPase (P-type)
MANQGLRVLFFAFKELREDFCEEEGDLDSGFTVLGCTAVEDLLQVDVKECI